MTPLTAAELACVLHGKLLSGDPNAVATGVTIDSRGVKPGDAFVAFSGERVDGHNYIGQAVQAGASVVLVTHPVNLHEASGTSVTECVTTAGVPNPDMTGSTDMGTSVIEIENALSAVQQLACHERASFTGPVIGVTGSNGKTTTKDMLRTVFQVGGPCLATFANLNTELGLPLTVLRRTKEDTSMVLEMGMRGPGQIRDLCGIARPSSGIITNIGQSHIELLGSQAAIADAKGELLEALPGDGVAALHAGDPWLQHIAPRSRAKVLWYGLDEQADAYATDIVNSREGISFTAHVLDRTARVLLPTFGHHNVVNALGALLLGAAHDLQLSDMADALRTLPAAPGRLRMVQGLQGWTVIDDCYNASPLSVQASLGVLKELTEGSVGQSAEGSTSVAILGDMYELGSIEEEGHRKVGRACSEMGIDTLITVGPKSRWTAEAAKHAGGVTTVHHFEDKAGLLSAIDGLAGTGELIPAGATVLVKASRGMELEDVVSALVGASQAAH